MDIVGPRNPCVMLGGEEAVCIDRADGRLTRQAYEDGWIYTASVPIGSQSLGPDCSVEGELLRLRGVRFDAWVDDTHVHVAHWIAHE